MKLIHLISRVFLVLFTKLFTKKKIIFQEEMDDESSDEENYTIISGARQRRSYPTKWAFDPNKDIVMPDDVTEKMMDNVVGRP